MIGTISGASDDSGKPSLAHAYGRVSLRGSWLVVQPISEPATPPIKPPKDATGASCNKITNCAGPQSEEQVNANGTNSIDRGHAISIKRIGNAMESGNLYFLKL